MDASIFLRLDDVLTTVRPSDAAKNLDDLDGLGGVEPASAAAMNALAGGTWTGGYLCNDAAGNATKAFGVVDMNPAGAPTYSLPGPCRGTDKAFGLTAAADSFSMSNANFGGGVLAAEDFAFFCVFKQPALTLGGQFVRVASNSTFGGGGGSLNIQGDFTSGFMQWLISDGVNVAIAQIALSAFTTGDYMALGVVLDRSTNRIRIAVLSLATGVLTMSAEVNCATVGSLANVAGFSVGGRLGTEAMGQLADYYYAKGVGNCTGMSAGLGTKLTNFAAAFLTTLPPVIDGVMGRARSFLPASLNGLGSKDLVAGTTLLNRDCSVQAIIKWDLAGQNTYGVPGTIIARGMGNAVAEYVAFGLELRVVNVAANVGELRWFWHDLAGVLKTQIGGHLTASSGWMLITATRRWVSPTECTLRYYVGDELLAEVTTADGSIGGGTTGTTSVGTRFTASSWDRFLAGAIDELRVVPRELTAEEVAATWNRITLYEPLGYTLIKELHPPGFPISKDPSSRVQKETRMWGQALGFAAAQAENVRDNILPDRAYGKILERWEDITKQSPKPGDSIDTRRARVVGRMRQRAGVSIPGASAALKELVATDPTNLQFLSWDQTIVDSFTALDLQRWDPDPSAQWTINANTLRVQAPAGTYTFDGPTTLWYTCPTTVVADVGNVGGSGTGARILTKLTPTLLPATSEVGVYFGDIVSGNYLLLGLRFDGAWKVVAEAFRAWVSQGLVLEATLGGMPASIWFQLWQQIPAGGAFGVQPATRNYSPAWSTTSALTGYTVGANISHISKFQWAGYYLRSVGAIASAVDVALDDLQLRTPSSDRPFHWYVYRDPALPGKLDLIGANNVIRGLKHAYTDARVITSKSLLYDDAASTFDAGPLGAI